MEADGSCMGIDDGAPGGIYSLIKYGTIDVDIEAYLRYFYFYVSFVLVFH